MLATDKQLKRVRAIIDYFGYEDINKYINKYFKNADMDLLTKEQAQKIISGWDMKIPRKPICNVFGRDFNIIK